jgi:hypothetical protein
LPQLFLLAGDLTSDGLILKLLDVQFKMILIAFEKMRIFFD